MADIKIGLIGGSGIGQLLSALAEGTRHVVETPFGQPSEAIVEADWGGVPVFFLARHGPGHLLSPSFVPYRANIFALKKLGVTHIIASGAVGSLRAEYKPRDLVIADQVIDKTHRRIGTFYDRAAVHVELAEPFCPALRRILLEEGRRGEDGGPRMEDGGARGEDGGWRVEDGDLNREGREPATGDKKTASYQSSILHPPSSILHSPSSLASSPHTVHDRGCYVCMEGPAFSTRAESLMHRLWGGDLIGMTAMPEAKLAREAEIGYALVALVTDYDSWRRPALPAAPKPGEAPAPADDPGLLLEEIVANLSAASDNGVRLIRRAVERIAASASDRDALEASPARRALRLAIWSDKSRIGRDEVELLGPLWREYFQAT